MFRGIARVVGVGIISWVCGFALFHLLAAVVHGGFLSSRETRGTAQFTAVAFGVAYIFVYIPLFVLLRKRFSSLALIGVGALVGLVVFLVSSYIFEGFDYGIVALFRDPLTWLWMGMFVVMGGVAGRGWQERVARIE